MIEGLPAHKFGEGPSFARVTATAKALGLDLAGFGSRSVLIVGSNGKGTTAAMTAAALGTRARTGLFTSPHLMCMSERIVIDGAPIGLSAMKRLSLDVAAARKAAKAASMGAFEHLFLMAALAFHRMGCEAIVWEAGIGGRLDPTRLVGAKMGALTSLDLEHTSLLGETLFAIGADKLDGFAAGATVFAGPGVGLVWDDLSAYAKASQKLLRHPSDVDRAPFTRLEAPFLQANASLAHAMTGRMMEMTLAAQVAIAATRLPGRLETLCADPLLVIDIAHTPDAASQALKGFRQALPEGGALLIGVSHGKKAKEIAAILAPAFSRIGCVAARHAGWPAESIAAIAAGANPHAVVSVHGAVDAGFSALRGEGRAIFATGSLYVAAEVKAAHLGLDPAALWYF